MKRLLSVIPRVTSRDSAAADSAYGLDRPLLLLSRHDPWRIRDACEGTAIFGATGSGKTSGSGAAIAKAFLRSEFGGLVLTAKPDERVSWQQYCAETGRSDSLRIISPEAPWRFNFLEYEATRPGAGAGITENLVGLFCNVLEVAERKNGSSSGQDYWQRTLRQLLRNAIDLLHTARGRVSLPELYQLISSAPQCHDDLQSERWQDQSLCFKCVAEGERKSKTAMASADFEMSARYWFDEFPNIADKTRSIIVSTFTSMCDGFLRGVLRELFCTTTNIQPEQTLNGDILLVDLPVKEYSEVGQFAQVLTKYIWQRAVERRNVAENARPVFLWADEAQYFVTSSDMQFQSTARSSRAATVYLTQNLPSYYAALGGGDRARSEADCLLGCLNSKIFHANGDSVTNNWAAELFSRSWQFRGSASTSSSSERGPFGNSPNQQVTAGGNQSLEYNVLPREFTTLRRGGPENDLIVEGIVFQGGRLWKATGGSQLYAQFSQKAT